MNKKEFAENFKKAVLDAYKKDPKNMVFEMPIRNTDESIVGTIKGIFEELARACEAKLSSDKLKNYCLKIQIVLSGKEKVGDLGNYLKSGIMSNNMYVACLNMINLDLDILYGDAIYPVIKDYATLALKPN